VRKIWQVVFVLGILIVVLAFTVGAGQQSKETQQESKTQLEAFGMQKGVVVFKGFSTLGAVSEMGKISVDCLEITNVSTGIRQLGILIDVEESGRLERKDRSFIDYDEIDSLLKGIDYISKVTSKNTKLNNFEATYKTKGDFAVTLFSNSRGGTKVAVKSGYIGSVTAFISTDKLVELRALIVQAKEKLDSIK
jgi:hypothetical protein